MGLEDIRIAKKNAVERNLTLCVVKDNHVLFESCSHGISGFLQAIEELGSQFERASVADKVVGKAVALLCLYTRVEAVYANVVSRRAKEILERNGVQTEWGEQVENILDNCTPAVCPFERLAGQIEDPAEAYKKLKALRDSLKQSG